MRMAGRRTDRGQADRRTQVSIIPLQTSATTSEIIVQLQLIGHRTRLCVTHVVIVDGFWTAQA